MSGFQTLGVAASGMNAARAGLYVIGHNMANSSTEGYSRQRVNQANFLYSTIGYNADGPVKVGLGADIKSIRQLRWEFFDIAYREQVNKLGYYNIRAQTGQEIEAIIGELQTHYKFQQVADDVWKALQELHKDPASVAYRLNFLSSCRTFVEKANNVYDRLIDYQHNLDSQVRDTVGLINEIVSEINELNKKIVLAEAANDNANDYRDMRNVYIDKLSAMIKVDYREMKDGRVDLIVEGKQLLVNGHQSMLGLKFITGDFSFVEPVFTNSSVILPADSPVNSYIPLFDLTKTPVSDINGNDQGSLLSLLICRGAAPANYLAEGAYFEPDPLDYALGQADPKYRSDYRTYELLRYSAQNCLIPQTMVEFDRIVTGIVTMINDAFAPYVERDIEVPDPSDPFGIATMIITVKIQDPDGPYNMRGEQTWTEVFSRNTHERWEDVTDLATGTVYKRLVEDPDENHGNFYAQYAIGNIRINPELLLDGGYNLICLTRHFGDREDNSLLLDLMEKWNTSCVDFYYDPGNPDRLRLSVEEAYRRFTDNIAIKTNQAIKYVETQTIMVGRAEDKRSEVMAVSLDEEMKNMLTYQYAYNAAARILNVIDSMMDRIINNMGRVGL